MERRIKVKKIKKTAFSLMMILLQIVSVLAQSRTNQPNDAEVCAACGTCGAGAGAMIILPIVAIVAVIGLNIALLVWVAKDAKARGLDNSVMWMLLVFFTGLIGFAIYYYSRPQGDLINCPHCNNKRLQSIVKCPTCGNA